MTQFPTAFEAARRIADGSLTSEALVRACLDRIGEREPLVQAWQHLDMDAALKMARQVDRFGSGPLMGTPRRRQGHHRYGGHANRLRLVAL
jgi:Asp-tRNA(Asn)/Glu-tRNA(Gln) amidotransferase A subunit family amidase